MATKKSTATGALYKSIDKPKARKAAAVKIPAAIRKQQDHRTVSIKIGVTIFPNDNTRINEIAKYMQDQTGELINKSDVIKLALRGVHLDKRLIDIYNEFKAEDGRKHKKGKR